ncbi:insulinase family protein [Nostoc sp. FACHB-152]|uniref:M16 family metallopeptidase n=1 Tax=unclassified Nostoc TaxID=2593658 RepID=UPI001684E59B|nr:MULTISPECIES: pitrilysin family protein [unclassified Nostoc]MBD2447676.1 insulinase family protein [Nostoc sp. FACHB-152]MBD2466968.1 insulinase family protein [Nostoc sp. FACHB-145]
MTQTVKTALSHSPIHRTVLNNGIVVLTAENPAADIIAARIFIRAGSCYEKPEQAGLAHLLSAVMTKGCDGLSSLEIAEQVESVGASLSADTSTDYFLLSLKTVTSDFPEILALTGRILRSPTFPEEQVELERRLALQDIRSQKEQPFTLAFEQMRQAMYQNHPYAMSLLGDETTMSSITRSDLVQYHQTHFRPDNLVISIAGRITLTEAVALVEQVFGDWQVPTQPLPILNLPEIPVNPQHRLKPLQTQQSIVMLGYLGAAVSSPDYASLKLLSTYLGNGLSSRLFVELREKRGLAYEVSAFYPTKLYPGSFVVYMGTAPENTSIALEGLWKEVDLLCSTEVSESAFQAAKNKILGQYALGKQTNGQIAQIYGWYEILGLGINFDSKFQEIIAAVNVDDAKATATRYLKEPYLSLVGQEDAINSALG